MCIRLFTYTRERDKKKKKCKIYLTIQWHMLNNLQPKKCKHIPHVDRMSIDSFLFDC